MRWVLLYSRALLLTLHVAKSKHNSGVVSHAALACWHLALTWPQNLTPTTSHAPLPAQVASLPTKQRLLQSLIAAWPRRTESQLGLTTPRTGLLQRACTTVDEWRAAAERSSRAGSAGDVLWHGIKVAFEEVGGMGS